MLKIGITQRSYTIPGRSENLDCLDQSLIEKFNSKNNVLIPLSNMITDISTFVDELKITGFILSGGNSINTLDLDYCPKRIQFEMDLLSYAANAKLPVVGICHGFQLINSFFHGKVERISNHVSCQHKVILRFPPEEKEVYVNSFHEYGIREGHLGKGLVPFAKSEDELIEGAYHETLGWTGVMWHPEREMPYQEIWVDILRSTIEHPKQVNISSIMDLI